MKFPDTNSTHTTKELLDSNSLSLLENTGFVSYDLYAGNLLQIGNNSIAQSAKYGNDWVLFVLLVVLVIITWVRIYHLKRFWQLLQAFMSSLQVDHIIRENDRLMGSVLSAFNAVFYLVASVFVYMLISHLHFEQSLDSIIHPYLIVLFVVIIVYQFKSWALKLLGVMFYEADLAAKYTFNVLLMNKILGLLLLPIVVLLSYVKLGGAYLIITGCVFIVVLYLLRIRRGIIIISNQTNLSYFHLFLYLCALEILPLSVLVRICYDRV